MKTVYYTGSYGPADLPTIYQLEFDTLTGEIRKVAATSGCSNASFLVRRGDLLLTFSESGADSHLATVRCTADGPASPEIIPYSGVDPCHISCSPCGDDIAVANYSSGDVALYESVEDFRAGRCYMIGFTGSGPDPRRQRSSHAHCARFSHDGQRLYICDLGADRIHLLAKRAGRFVKEGEFAAPSGSGPRMIELSADGSRGYLICELSGTVLVLDMTADIPALIQEITADRWHSRGAGDIHLSADGRFLYASVRLAHDGIAVFAVDPQTGLLNEAGYIPTGVHPRNFILTPDGNYMLVACRDENAVEVYRRDPVTGMAERVPGSAEVAKVVCIG